MQDRELKRVFSKCTHGVVDSWYEGQFIISLWREAMVGIKVQVVGWRGNGGPGRSWALSVKLLN